MGHVTTRRSRLKIAVLAGALAALASPPVLCQSLDMYIRPEPVRRQVDDLVDPGEEWSITIGRSAVVGREDTVSLRMLSTKTRGVSYSIDWLYEGSAWRFMDRISVKADEIVIQAQGVSFDRRVLPDGKVREQVIGALSVDAIRVMAESQVLRVQAGSTPPLDIGPRGHEALKVFYRDHIATGGDVSKDGKSR